MDKSKRINIRKIKERKLTAYEGNHEGENERKQKRRDKLWA